MTLALTLFFVLLAAALFQVASLEADKFRYFSAQVFALAAAIPSAAAVALWVFR